MGDITHFLDDVTRFSPIQKTDRDRYMELGPYWCKSPVNNSYQQGSLLESV